MSDLTGKYIPGQKFDWQKQHAFNRVMKTVNSFLLGANTLTEKVTVYDYAIWTLAREIAADGHMLFLSGKDTPENRYYSITYTAADALPSQENAKLDEGLFDLSTVPTYTGPWDPSRFPMAIASTMQRGYKQELASNSGIYYKELNFAVMLEGRHHTSLGIFSGDCKQKMQILTLEPYFPTVYTDGACFKYTLPNGNDIKSNIVDYRFAAMYRLAQRKWEDQLPVNFKETLKNKRKEIKKVTPPIFAEMTQEKFDEIIRQNEERKLDDGMKILDLEADNKRLRQILEDTAK